MDCQLSSSHAAQRHLVVAFEGNIGVGKSTLCDKLAKSNPSHLGCSIYKEQTNEGFLKLFYSDPVRYGFAFQWGMLQTRLYQYELARRDSSLNSITPSIEPLGPFTTTLHFWDRSMVGDYVFALWNHLTGGITVPEMKVYEERFFNDSSATGLAKGPSGLKENGFMDVVSAFIVLEDEPRRCKSRVEDDRKNASESNIPLPYYEGIDDIHFYLFVLTMAPCKKFQLKVLKWGDYDDERLLWREFGQTLGKPSGTLKSISVERMHLTLGDVELNMLGRNRTVYRNATDVQRAYTNMTNTTRDGRLSKSLGALPNCSSSGGGEDSRPVLIPHNIMTIPPQSKGVSVEALKRYPDLVFYENAYKRVVMDHLARGDSIAFYEYPLH